MPHKSQWSVAVPELSVPTHLLGSPTAPLPDSLAFADADRPKELFLTWNSFRLWSQRLAVGLRRRCRLQDGDRVLTFSGNNVMFPVAFMGVLMAGGVYAAANARAVEGELAHVLSIARPKVLLTSPENLQVALRAAAKHGLNSNQIFVFDDTLLTDRDDSLTQKTLSPGVQSWKCLMASEAEGRGFAWNNLTGEPSKTTEAVLAFSSGTTGLPKGIVGSHHALIANAVQTDYVMSLDPDLKTRQDSAARSRWLCALPLYHGLGLAYYGQLAAIRRIPTYIMKQFDLSRMLSHIQTHKITELQLVPPMMVGMMKHPGLSGGPGKQRYNLSSVTKTFSCAAPLGAETTRQYEALWPKGKMNVKQGLASTETMCNTLGWDPTLTASAGSVGEPMPNCEVKLVDDNDQELTTTGEAGELLIRSYNRMLRYVDNPKATEETITPDGWLRTGDVARKDENGYYYIVDRKKEMMKVKGVQVAPAELEAVLLEHPGINDVGVAGFKTSDGDEMPRAFIVPKPGVKLTQLEIMEFMKGKVSGIKRLTGGVVFVPAIPKTPSGKILRRQLRDMKVDKAKL